MEFVHAGFRPGCRLDVNGQRLKARFRIFLFGNVWRLVSCADGLRWFRSSAATRPSLFLCLSKERGERKDTRRPWPCGQTSNAHSVTRHRSHAPSRHEAARAASCRPTPRQSARSRQGLTGLGKQDSTSPTRPGRRLLPLTFNPL
ncbi:hypothetical protein Thpro_021515 [Acidihalobacter prosperus]|uniref:Uncharacterized protein n=1 Tax=Acidihalobacter prosperus TaxID=160660 RepID=A0A1A6C3P6_9GAMM|nr:hypothetical protein Thpro_021515 [Acidihalobacter prosperus]